MLFVLECLIFVFALDHSDSVQSTKCVKISFIVADCIIMTRLVVTNYIQEYKKIAPLLVRTSRCV